MDDLFYMKRALKLAAKAEEIDEIPIGAVIVMNDTVISEAFNTNRSSNDPTCHAEILAIRKATEFIKNERLTGCRIYVTKEPCAMCAGAIIHARIEEVIIAAEDIKYGACGTVFDVCGNAKMNHHPKIKFGVLKEESASMLKSFFQKKRKKN